MITVTNKHHRFSICRGTPLGNPFIIKEHGTRDQVIEMYEKYIREKVLLKDPAICNELNKIYKTSLQYDVSLECYCKGFANNCHGDIIKDILLSKAKNMGKIEQICAINNDK